jgi:rhamnulose-1-phosphate aldolase/alcohol dehydrogenase
MSNSTTPQELSDLVARSQRLGADPSLVLFGGGNTSSKGEIVDYLGRKRNVLWVKGSGADLKSAGEKDYPALYLEELLALNNWKSMSDDEMVDFVTRALVDPSSRRPSIETLLHAFLPAKHIDHVHADAICALTNHSDGKRAVKEALGDGFAYVEWYRPGFELSKIVETLKDHEGVVLAHHGLVVWDENTDKCYAKNGAAIDKANAYLKSLSQRPESKFVHHELSDEELTSILLKLRGAMGKPQVVRYQENLKAISQREDLDKIIAAGTSSADHMLRIRPKSAIVNLQTVKEDIDSYRSAAHKQYEDHKDRLPEPFPAHDSNPRVIFVPGLGGFTAAPTIEENAMVATIAEHTHGVAAQALDSFGNAKSLSNQDVFDFDYWPMELYKLKLKPAGKKFTGKVFIVTGAGSGIGRAIALELGELGANIVIADIDSTGANEVADEFTKRKFNQPLVALGDLSDEKVVNQVVTDTIKNYGGVDGAVINAGIGVAGNLEQLELSTWEAGLKINLTSAFLMTKKMLSMLRTQGMGGSLVYIASKNAFGPSAGFGGYSVTKAGMLQLMRIAALEGGSVQIRANALNPDAIFDHSKLWEGGVREQRAAQHGVAPDKLEDFYASRNILKAHVRGIDVARSVAFLLSDDSSRTTGAVIAVDGGVAAAFPR